MKSFIKLFMSFMVPLMWYCSNNPMSPSTRVAIEFKFVTDHTAQMKLGKNSGSFQNPNLVLNKAREFGTEIDQVMILVLDFSVFDSSAQYFASEEYQEYVKTRDNWPGDLCRWAEWEKLLGDYFRIVVDQSLNLEGDHAEGVVSGVIGLNYICVALIADGKIQYWGEGEVKAEVGKTVEAMIHVWGYNFEDLFYITINPYYVILNHGQTQQFTCTAYYFNQGSTVDVTNLVSWSISPGIAGTINSTGLFTADVNNSGTETVTATYQDQSAEATVIVETLTFY